MELVCTHMYRRVCKATVQTMLLRLDLKFIRSETVTQISLDLVDLELYRQTDHILCSMLRTRDRGELYLYSCSSPHSGVSEASTHRCPAQVEGHQRSLAMADPRTLRGGDAHEAGKNKNHTAGPSTDSSSAGFARPPPLQSRTSAEHQWDSLVSKASVQRLKSLLTNDLNGDL